MTDSARALGKVTGELAAELDEAVWRIIENREDRVAHLMVETDGVEVAVDALPDHHRRLEGSRRTVSDEGSNQNERVLGLNRDADQVERCHPIKDRAA